MPTMGATGRSDGGNALSPLEQARVVAVMTSPQYGQVPLKQLVQ